MRKLIKVVLVTVTFLVFSTVAMSIMYELDSALLRF
jgi:hypothetical protein